MRRISPPGRGKTSWRTFAYRPRVEPLEPRLPPGNVLGILLTAAVEAPTFPNVSTDLDRADLRIEDDGSADALAWSFPRRRTAAATFVRVTDETDDARKRGDTPAHANSLGAEPFTCGQAGEVRQSLSPALSAPPRFASVATVSSPESNALGSHMLSLRDASAKSFATPVTAAERSASKALSEADRSQVLDDYGELPLSFEANQGQTDTRVDFITRAGGATVFLTPTAAVFTIQNSESRSQNSVLEPGSVSDACRVRAGSVSDESRPGVRRLRFRLGRKRRCRHPHATRRR